VNYKELWKLTAADGSEYPIDDVRWRSDEGDLLDIAFRPLLEMVQPDNAFPGLWKYKDLLPVFGLPYIVSFGEGDTPVVKEQIGGTEFLLKLEYLFPTGSYKDRGASVLISKIKELGIKEIVEDSSGNAGCAIAAYAAKAGIRCEILVSVSTSPAKIRQLEAYGAKVTKIAGDRQAVANAALEKAQTAYYASHSWNPFFFQGTKTFAYEIAAQCRDNFPGGIVLPVGNGTLLIGAYLGFAELYECGLIPFIPKMIAVQAANCAPLLEEPGPFAPTIAEGIAVRRPVRRQQILDIIRKTGGTVITVEEQAIAEAWSQAALRGYYIEKTSAAGWAALAELPAQERYLLALTGHGLKNT